MPIKVRGYATVFGVKDRDGEVIDRGAFSDWITANPDTSLSIYWNHSHLYSHSAKPIGHTTKLKQDRTGLYFEGVLNDTAEGIEVAKVLSAKRMEASFAFKAHDHEVVKEVRHFKAVSPFEITAANFGANPKAYIEVIPGQDSNNGVFENGNE